MPTKNTKPTEADRALKWVDQIRHCEMGHSENEKRLIALADEVLRLRRELRCQKTVR